MDRMPRLSGKELARAVERFGFVHIHTAGSHMVFRHPDGRHTTVPVHDDEEIGPGLLDKIVKKDLGLTKAEFESNL